MSGLRVQLRDVSDGDILIPLALILAGRETEGADHYLARLEETLSKVAKHGGYNAVGNANSRVVVAVPSAKLLQTELAFHTLVTIAGVVGFLLPASHYSKNLL